MSYVVQRRLGRGGMGVVDLAVDEQGRSVACKRLLLHGSAHEMHRARQRIRREASVLARLQHPNVVPLLEVLDDGDDVVLVLPYLAGGTLADQVAHHGPLSPGQVHVLADALFAALAAAHREGIVHRDIKPANVLFDEAGTPYLADFGVATIRDATGGLTVTGAVVGTPEFMAPEQARGEEAGPAADVFSLGATLLFAATGNPPYGRGEAAVVLPRAARGRLAPLPAGLDRTLRRRLMPTRARAPQRRPSASATAASARPRPDRGAGADAAGIEPLGPAGTRIVSGELPRRPGRPVKGLVLGTLAALAVVLVAVVLTTRVGGDDAVGTIVAPVTTEPCQDLPYQPCGQPAAPGTDGVECLAGRADYDGDPTNGCEAVSNVVAGQTLDDRVEANLVPGDAIERFGFRVDHSFNLFCNNTLRVELTSPDGAAMRLDVLSEGDVLGTAVSADGDTATVTLDQPDCFGNTNRDLVARVSWVGERRTADDFVLTRSGKW
ncbi:serine/threonine-protein kinase [Rhabdothermincola salaria]|uniref:serine/threonine-protein kinase n=1 Tax=Rhabdothermincola salaria TaxID=2903142 RepID=UPI001E5DC8DC|nr:serine/threonine protein kinase [Rhabdothermincola salaria]